MTNSAYVLSGFCFERLFMHGSPAVCGFIEALCMLNTEQDYRCVISHLNGPIRAALSGAAAWTGVGTVREKAPPGEFRGRIC